MWKPTDIVQFEQAVREGILEERHDFDAKRQLPSSGKELAKDVAAMTTDGGVLVYGVDEDGDERPRILAPIELAGAAQRIDQVAQQSISGTPRLEFVHLRLPDDEARGYLIVLIPPSPEAPHQVIVGNDRRFYGRSDTGNRRLSEEEISRLYERRRSQQVDRERLLAECVAQSRALISPASATLLVRIAEGHKRTAGTGYALIVERLLPKASGERYIRRHLGGVVTASKRAVTDSKQSEAHDRTSR